MLFGQGTTDTLFNLQQGLANWQHSITAAARKESIFVGYNGGHVLPSVLPAGVTVTSDPCSEKLAGGTFADLALRFMNEQLKGRDTGLSGYGRYHLATPTAPAPRSARSRPTRRTTSARSPRPRPRRRRSPTRSPRDRSAIAGLAVPHRDVTALGVNNRAFYGLAVGTSPADAHLVQNNVLPLNEPDPVTASSAGSRCRRWRSTCPRARRST